MKRFVLVMVVLVLLLGVVCNFQPLPFANSHVSIRATIANYLRKVVSNYTAEEIYGGCLENINKELETVIQNSFE